MLTEDGRPKKKPGKSSKKPARSILDVLPDNYKDLLDFHPDDWSKAFGHIPVMAAEAVNALDVLSDGFYVDLTLGGGGHSRFILSMLGPKGRLLCLDKDPDALAWASVWAGGDRRVILKKSSFEKIDSVLEELNLGPADGLLADLGLSARQIFSPGRGFSWLKEEPLDMRMDPETNNLTACQIINTWPEDKLADLIRFKAEERSSVRLSKSIINERAIKPFQTTVDLAKLVYKVLRRSGHHSRMNPATKLFMGLRLTVNQEMEALSELLKIAPVCLKPKGRLAVISFHSLEDRLVKSAFGSIEGRKIWESMYKKPITASKREIERNRRARSAKLRIGRLRQVDEEVLEAEEDEYL
ncbi:MAG: 16S rRNA (cytosine(1402)-N(4))-methyltransferase RsmH [Deltaproteobacteria bacterium]|jgi:16S rRNA (cytosine1402-N4)-methyltransferase|nr:16S rRNA (cytosine(1402)-N(4))-methyltransferase RsmH [Deltaproteobacteria bacterium]